MTQGNMAQRLTISEARMQLIQLLDSSLETLEIMSDPELMAELRQSIAEAENGELIPWEDIKRENGW